LSVDFEPYSHRWQQDPYPVYRELRDRAPVQQSPSGAWTIARYDDVQQVLDTPEVFSSKTRRERMAGAGPLHRIRLGLRFARGMRLAPWKLGRSRMLIREDGDVHALMRNIVNRGFTPRRIEVWEKRIDELAQEGLGRVRANREFDLVEELAVPLPVTVISEFLGVESHRQKDFKSWSDAIIQGGTGSGQLDLGGKTLDAMVSLRRYLTPIVAERRRQPAEDLISLLVTADGDAVLSDFEIFLFVLLLLIAGNETTTNLLGNAVEALLDHPDQLERVCADPSRVPDLIEEALRFDSPVQFLNRRTLCATEVAGVRIPKDADVVALLGSANRDERRFPEPDRFDIGRDTRGHLAFGFGAHFCLGAALARLEAKAALEALLPELPRLTRVHEQREFLDSYLIRGRARLELRRAA
jgi:cytochrome P450